MWWVQKNNSKSGEPIDSHVTSGKEKRKLNLPYFHISNSFLIQRLSATFNISSCGKRETHSHSDDEKCQKV